MAARPALYSELFQARSVGSGIYLSTYSVMSEDEFLKVKVVFDYDSAG